MRRVWQIAAMLALAFFSYLMIRLTLQYRVMRGNIGFLVVKQHAYKLAYWRVCFYTHVFTGWLVLIAGFTQFSPWLLRRRRVMHRIMGWSYLVVVLFISGPAAFVMALYANGGWAGRISFTLLAVLWWSFTFTAGYFAMRKKFALHGTYMFLSYALTLSAITLRAYTWLVHMAHLPINPRTFYSIDAWISWVPNLIVALILIRRGWVRKIYDQRDVSVKSAPLSFPISHRRQSETLPAGGASGA